MQSSVKYTVNDVCMWGIPVTELKPEGSNMAALSGSMGLMDRLTGQPLKGHPILLGERENRDGKEREERGRKEEGVGVKRGFNGNTASAMSLECVFI